MTLFRGVFKNFVREKRVKSSLEILNRKTENRITMCALLSLRKKNEAVTLLGGGGVI